MVDCICLGIQLACIIWIAINIGYLFNLKEKMRYEDVPTWPVWIGLILEFILLAFVGTLFFDSLITTIGVV